MDLPFQRYSADIACLICERVASTNKYGKMVPSHLQILLEITSDNHLQDRKEEDSVLEMQNPTQPAWMLPNLNNLPQH